MNWESCPPFGFKKSDSLIKEFESEIRSSFSPFEINPIFSHSRLSDAFDAWKYDLKTKKDNFANGISSPDHIKCAGYLLHWLARMAPITSIEDTFSNYATESERKTILGQIIIESDPKKIDSSYEKINPSQVPFTIQETFRKEKGFSIENFIDHRFRLMSYSNEYAAWDFCYRLARNFEVQKNIELGVNVPLKDPAVTYIHDFCHVLRYKNISPQGVAFVLRTCLRDLK